MTIKTRLWLIVIIATLGLFAIFVTGKHGINAGQASFDEVVDHRLPTIVASERLIIAQQSIQRDVRELILVKDIDRRKDINTRIDHNRSEGNQLLHYLDQVVDSADGKLLIQNLNNQLSSMIKINNDIRTAIMTGNDRQAENMIIQVETRNQWVALKSSLQALIEYQEEQTKLSDQKGEETLKNADNLMFIIGLLSFTMVVGIALIVIKVVSSSIQEIVTSVSSVVNSMRFNHRLPVRKDELNQINHVINSMFNTLELGMKDINRVTSSLAKGEFNQRITNNYNGDLDDLKKSINHSIDSIAHVMSTLATSMEKLKMGSFDHSIDTQASGQYGEMLSNANDAMKTLNQIIGEITSVMNNMTQGDFNSRVNGVAFGQLLTMKNNINTSMSAMSQAIQSISEVVEAQAQGDLTKALPSGIFKGQLHDLKNAINYSANKVKSSVIQATSASNIVNAAAKQVSQGSSDLSGRVQEQAAALEETSATMNEMAAAVQANTANAKKVAELAHQVQIQSGAGVDVMQQTISAMQSIKESSTKIADIVTIIDGIAFQTNLLALNAAVEAARAGEHGRGFAVVAGEVRALAQKSAEAAKDIKDLIHDSVSRIEVGTQLADKSGEMLSGITGSIEQVAEMIESIANASHEQSQGIHQVHLAMTNIDRVTQENSALVEETSAAAESLSNEATNLKQNMGFFKTAIG